MSRSGFSRPNVSTIGDVLVEISVRNDLLKAALGEAETTVKRSTERMNRTVNQGGLFGGGGRGIGGLQAAALRGTGIAAGISAVPSAVAAIELNMNLLNGIIKGIQGDTEEFRKSFLEVAKSTHRFATSLPLIGGLIDGAATAINDFVKRWTSVDFLLALGIREGTDKKAREVSESLAGPFSANTAGGTVKFGDTIVHSDSIQSRQHTALKDIHEQVREINRSISNISLVVSQ